MTRFYENYEVWYDAKLYQKAFQTITIPNRHRSVNGLLHSVEVAFQLAEPMVKWFDEQQARRDLPLIDTRIEILHSIAPEDFASDLPEVRLISVKLDKDLLILAKMRWQGISDYKIRPAP